MKSSFVAMGVVGLALAGLWYAGGGTTIPPQSVAAAEQARVSTPMTHDNLTVFFVHGPDSMSDSRIATLQEAMEAGWAVVHETGNVNTLAVENRSPDYEVFIQEGDLIRGGRQDRMIAADMLLPPKSGLVPFPCHCVEQGRWTGRGNEAATHFNKCDQFAVGKGMKYANATGQQTAVWQNVAANQDNLSKNLNTRVNCPESASSFQLTLENPVVKAKVADFEEAFRAAGERRNSVVGVVFVMNGQVTGAEVYGSNALFLKAWPKLLRSAATEAIAEKSDRPIPPAPTAREVERYLAFAGRQDAPVAGSSGSDSDKDLTNEDVGLVQVNQAPALSGLQGTNQRDTQNGVLTGRSGSTRVQLLRHNGGGAHMAPNSAPNPAANPGGERLEEAVNLANGRDGANPMRPSAPPTVVNPDGNRLNVNRVENAAGLMTESRDPARQNALVHKSYIKSDRK